MYSNSGTLPCIHKGHLVPAETYSFSKVHLSSTFTYTNAVPQYATFNTGQWSAFERRIRNYAKLCSQQNGDLYLLTGVSDSEIEIQGKFVKAFPYTAMKRMPEAPNIVIPTSMWTAGCCVRGEEALGSFAVIGNNDPDRRKINMSQMWVTTLANRIGVQQLFPGNRGCYRNDIKI